MKRIIKFSLVLMASLIFAGCTSDVVDSAIAPIDDVILSNQPQTKMPIIQTETLSSDSIAGYDKEQCIGSFYQYAYEVREYERSSRPTDILPPPAWELVHEFPDDDAHEGLMNIRESNGEIEIWTSRIVFGEYPHNDITREAVFYDEDFIEINSFYRFIGDMGIWTDRVFFHPNGTIWGRNMWKPSGEYPIDTIPILSKYNSQTNQFEFDPLAFEIPLIQDDYSFNDWVEIILDTQGIFWFFAPEDGLYSYDPIVGITKKHVDLPDFRPLRFLLGANGSLYFTEDAYSINSEGVFEFPRAIYMYSPESDYFGVIGMIGEDWHTSGPWLADRDGRLWFGAVGWFNAEEGWNNLHPDFEAYVEKVTGKPGYWWATPKPVLQSSNGIIWFWMNREIESGLAWYDPETGEGCWITNLLGGIYEDPDQNIWLSINNQLYKKSLSE